MTTHAAPQPTEFEKRLGQPPGLFLLFFAEMWERFSFYGMRALLVFYMTKGFLKLDDDAAYEVYGAYTSLVYATPFIGGMVADRLLGARRAVIIGGLLMAAGHLLMTVESAIPFYTALALLIAGNGFFKPNISTIVGSLYHTYNREKRDSGFTIFYMGINLGAAMASLICGYIGETYGWHYGFGLATIGMLIGVAVFTAPALLTQLLIGGGALAAAGVMVWKSLGKDFVVALVNLPIAAALLVAAGIAVYALQFGVLPHNVGAPPTTDKLSTKQGIVLVLTALFVPAAALLVKFSHFSTYVLVLLGVVAFGFILYEAITSEKVARERLFVVLAMCFFSMIFWAFFEQAGSSLNNFTDRNVDRVRQDQVITAADVGKTIDLRVGQEQVGLPFGAATLTFEDKDAEGKVTVMTVAQGEPFTIDELDAIRGDWNKREVPQEQRVLSWTVAQEHVGMGATGTEIPASEFQAANPTFILLFGLVFSIVWAELGKRNLEPSTPAKFVLGLVQLGLGFLVLWWGAQQHDARGMVAMGVLLMAYLLHTTGELCLSPVGLSMVTKLSPQALVSTVMGAWFLATAFSQNLASVIAKLTSVGGEEGGEAGIPVPLDTVNVYGDVFMQIGGLALASAVLLAILTPLLKKWMHPEVPMTGEEDDAPAH